MLVTVRKLFTNNHVLRFDVFELKKGGVLIKSVCENKCIFVPGITVVNLTVRRIKRKKKKKKEEKTAHAARTSFPIMHLVIAVGKKQQRPSWSHEINIAGAYVQVGGNATKLTVAIVSVTHPTGRHKSISA